MKKLLCALFIMAGASQAGAYATYDASEYSCNEMNSVMAEQEAVYIYNQTGFGGKQIYVDDRRTCGECYRPVVANFKTNDGWCTIGYKCQENHNITDKKNKSRREKRKARACRKAWREGRLN